ncbi:MAG: PPC domain-containing protein, partial [Fimbriimonadaceae bacterium]
WELPIGVLIDISAESNLFDINFGLYSPQGNPITNEDDSGESTNAHYQMLVTQPGTYYVRVGSLGDGGGGHFELHRTVTAPKKYESGATIKATNAKPSLQLFEAKKGKFFYLAIEKNHDIGLALFQPDGKRANFSTINEPNGRVIIMINPEVDGNYLLVITTNDPQTDVKITTVKVGQ